MNNKRDKALKMANEQINMAKYEERFNHFSSMFDKTTDEKKVFSGGRSNSIDPLLIARMDEKNVMLYKDYTGTPNIFDDFDSPTFDWGKNDFKRLDGTNYNMKFVDRYLIMKTGVNKNNEEVFAVQDIIISKQDKKVVEADEITIDENANIEHNDLDYSECYNNIATMLKLKNKENGYAVEDNVLENDGEGVLPQ